MPRVHTKTKNKAQPVAKRPPLAELSAAERLAHAAELTATMEEHREGYLEYERAHLAMRAGKLAPTKAAKVKAANRDAHRTYWSCYERRRALRKLMAAEAQGA
jgi:hypothetical protein